MGANVRIGVQRLDGGEPHVHACAGPTATRCGLDFMRLTHADVRLVLGRAARIQSILAPVTCPRCLSKHEY